MGLNTEYLECADGRVLKFIHIPRPYYRVHTHHADGGVTVKEYGEQLEVCDNDRK